MPAKQSNYLAEAYEHDGQWHGFILVELSGIGVRLEENHQFTQSLLNQQTDFIATLTGLTGRANIELRYVALPDPAAPQRGSVLAGIRLGFVAADKVALEVMAEQFHAEVFPHASSISSHYQWRLVADQDTYASFVCEQSHWENRELARRERWIHLETVAHPPRGNPGFLHPVAEPVNSKAPRRVYVCYPFIRSYDSLEGLFKELLLQRVKTVLVVQLRPTQLLPAEADFLSNQLLECERHMQAPLNGMVSEMSLFFPSLRTQAAKIAEQIHHTIDALRDDIFEMNVVAHAPSRMSPLLCESIGVAISEHVQTTDPLSDAGTTQSRSAFSGGFDWITPSNSLEQQALFMASRWMLGRTGQTSVLPDHLRIRRLCDISQAACAFRLPVPITGNFPGLPTRRVLDLSPPKSLHGEGLLLGVCHHHGVAMPIYLGALDRLRHCYAVGKTGTGKSTFLKNGIVQDILGGHGIAVFDPHGELIDEIMPLIPPHRIADVRLIKPEIETHSVGLNLLDVDNEIEKDSAVNYLMEVFNAIFNMDISGGPIFEMYFRNALMLLMSQDDGCVPILQDVMTLFSSDSFRRKKLEHCTDEEVIHFWNGIAERAGGDHTLQNFGPYITSKLVRFTHTSIGRRMFGQRTSTVDFEDVIESRRILLVDLSKGTIGELAARFIGMSLIKMLQTAAYRRSLRTDDHSKKPFYVYVDEFQNLATPSFESLLSESRKYGVGMVLTNQYVHQIPKEVREAIFGNIGTLLGFRLGAEDAEIVSKSFAPHVTEKDFTNLPNFNAYASMLNDGDICNPVNVYVERSRTKSFPESTREIMDGIQVYSVPTPSPSDTSKPDREAKDPRSGIEDRLGALFARDIFNT